MKLSVFGLLVVFGLTLVLSNQGRAATILWDDSHDTDGDELSGNTSAFAASMATAGHILLELDGVPGAITPTALVGVDAFFLWDAELALTTSEITTLQNFVEAGGGLFVAYDAGTDLTSNNALLAPYGLSLSTTPAASTVSGFVPHPITSGLTSITTSAGGTVGTTGAAIDLTVAGGSSNVLAVSAAPRRVVAFGDTGTFTTVFSSADNRKLGVNMANFTVAPEPAFVAHVAVASILLSLYRRKKAPHNRI